MTVFLVLRVGLRLWGEGSEDVRSTKPHIRTSHTHTHTHARTHTDTPFPHLTATRAYTQTHVPFVNRPFESEIHGTVNFTQFCCVLLVTWCYRVLLSCYLRRK